MRSQVPHSVHLISRYSLPKTLHNIWKKKLCLQEALDLFQSLLSEIHDVLTNDFSDKEVPANYLLELSLDS
ncbi:UNVERIFIED_CONTAM: hypothetical protein NCL1_38170 [Trichonephila clavipes]